MADSLTMGNRASWALWHAAYRRLVRSSFATVPLYREHWALAGRTDPVLVPGRTGTDGGALAPEILMRRTADLVPLAGGSAVLDPLRGLGSVLPWCVPLRVGTVVAVGTDIATHPPSDLPRGVRGCLLGPGLENLLHGNRKIVAVATTAELGKLPYAVDPVPCHEVGDLPYDPYGLVTDPVLGVLGGVRACGRRHLDWTRVYARETSAGLAFSLLRQRSPRLVDVLAGGGVPGSVEACPRHGTPVLRT